MSKRLEKLKLVKGQKWERQDPLDNLGVRTVDLIKDAIKEGKKELAKDLADYYYFWETKFVLDINVDLVGGFPSFWMESYGEETLFEVYRLLMIRNRGLESWPVLPIKRHDDPPVDHLANNIDYAFDHGLHMVRPHRMGALDGTGGFVMKEFEDRYEVLWDPCYTGGRMRRGDQISKTPPYTSHPYNYYTTQAAHDWTGGKRGLTGYCIHCYILHDLMDVEQTGYLGQWVVSYPDNPWDPCPYVAYKDLDWIPEEAYTKLGKVKPKVRAPVPKFKDITKPIRTVHSHNLGPFWRVKDGETWIHVLPRLKTAIDEGETEKALTLIDRLWAETCNHHATYPITWNWQWISYIVERFGYSEVYHALRNIYSPMEPPLAPTQPKPTKATIPPAEQRIWKAATWGRGDLSGPDQEGSVNIIDEPDRIVMELKPCGSGGRGISKIGKLDPVRQAAYDELLLSAKIVRGPFTDPPYNLKVTTEPHDVNWHKVGIPDVCMRCCVHFEMAAFARNGYLTTIIDRPENHTDPNCKWYFYKDLDKIPVEFYKRVGLKKPAPQKKK
jgi:hypothetical protein